MDNKMRCRSLLAFFASFTLFFFAPIEIYFSIYEDVWFGLEHIIGLVLLMFVSSFSILFIFLVLLDKWNEKWATIFKVFVFSLVVSAYIQGNFLMSSFGSMDGQAVNWSAYGFQNIISVAMWSAVIGISFGGLCRIGQDKYFKVIKVLMVWILLIQGVTLTVLCFTTDGLQPKNKAAFSDKNLFSYSKDKNVIVLLLDMYDSQVFQEICNEENNEKYLESLDGFTYYPDTVGAYSQTYCAIPHILTGEKYLNNGMIQDYVDKAYVKSPLFSVLQKNDYEINIYTNEAVPSQKEVGALVNNYLSKEESKIYVSSNRRMISYLGKLIGIRYLPQPLKQYCWFYAEEFWGLRDINHEDELYALDNFGYDERIKEADAEAERKTFHFYHLEGVHAPCYYDENFNRTQINIAKEGQSGMIRNGKGMLIVVRHFLQKLKDLGIYDDCAIVIMADHGGGYIYGEQDVQVARQNPLLLVKGFGEVHPLKISEMPLSYDDLQNAFVKLIEGKKGNKIFEGAAENKERFFITLTSFTEYVTEGHAADVSSLRPTGKVYRED